MTWKLEDNCIFVVFVPPKQANWLQAMDVAINKPFKDIYRELYPEWYAGYVERGQTSDFGLIGMKIAGADHVAANKLSQVDWRKSLNGSQAL